MINQADIRILHVDDEPEFAELTTEFLEREDDSFTVKTATSASKGLEHLSHDDFDCIISDYDMPGQNGVEFLKSVRKKAPHLPFVLFTGKGSEEIACEAISAGVTDYLQKGSTTDQYTVLANRLRNAVRQHRTEKDCKRQRKAIETAQEGISILNEDGEYTYVNQAYADMYGYEPGEMNGEHWELIYPDDETAIAQDVIFPTVAEDGYWSGKTTGLRADGTTFLEDHTVAKTDTGELICSVRDRSVEQEAELEMQSAAMEAAMDGISILNGDSEYIYMNQAHADVFEYDADELLGSTWQRLYDDDEIARIEQEIFPALEREGEWRGETVGKRRDGSPVHHELTLSLLDDGKLICTNRDITKRNEREQELQMVRERFEQFAGNVQDAFFLLPADYSETEYVNPAVEHIYGVTPEEAYDDPMVWLRHVHPDDKDDLLADVEAQEDKTTDWPIEQEFRIDHPDRGMRWVQSRLNVIADENGDPSRVTGVTTDVTDRKQREESLNALIEVTRDLMNAQDKQTVAEQAVNAVRSVLDHPINGLWLQDSEKKVLQPVAMTAESAEVVGAPPTYSGGESLSWEAFTANELRIYDDVRTHPERVNAETPIRSEIIIPLGEHGVMNIGATELATFSEVDVSMARIFGKTVEMALDRADREQQLQNQRSRLQQQNDRLDEFTGVVSHDLRNPLNVATGRLKLAAEECDSAHLDDLGGALNRMETLIDDLLMLAREGKEVTDAQSVDLAAMVNGCWENVETDQAKLITNIDQGVWADRSRLKQVFENLFRNAVEHGWADVTVTIGGLDDGFYIEDDGPGIPSDERDAVFEAGYSQSTNGTGFGLSIAKQVVDAHGWHIRVTDGTGGGARFEITNVEFVDT